MTRVSYTPLSEDQLKALSPKLADGIADFEVIKSEAKESKAGNLYISLQFKAWDSQGNHGTVFDHLMLAADKMQWKTRHFFEATDHIDMHEKGEWEDSDLVGFTGKFNIKMGKEKNGYPAKLEVVDYVGTTAKQQTSGGIKMPPSVMQDDFKDDDIPF